MSDKSSEKVAQSNETENSLAEFELNQIAKVDQLPGKCKLILARLFFDNHPAEKMHDCIDILDTLYESMEKEGAPSRGAYIPVQLSDFFRELAQQKN